MLRPPPPSTLFPYTTLFRSYKTLDQATGHHQSLRLASRFVRSEEHTSELQSRLHLVCRLLLEKKNKKLRTELANYSRLQHYFCATGDHQIATGRLQQRQLPLLETRNGRIDYFF